MWIFEDVDTWPTKDSRPWLTLVFKKAILQNFSLAVFPTTYTPLVKISAVTAKNIEVLAYFLVYKFCEKQSFLKVSGESL